MNEKEALERRRYYLECLIRFLEAKAERAESLAEFEDIMESLFKARDETKDVGIQILKCSMADYLSQLNS